VSRKEAMLQRIHLFAGVPFCLVVGAYMADFAPAFDYMESHEDALRNGVVTRDEDQRARFGICEKFHPNLPEEFWTGPAAEAFEMARQIYRAEYWLKLRLGEAVDQAVASKLFD